MWWVNGSREKLDETWRKHIDQKLSRTIKRADELNKRKEQVFNFPFVVVCYLQPTTRTGQRRLVRIWKYIPVATAVVSGTSLAPMQCTVPGGWGAPQDAAT